MSRETSQAFWQSMRHRVQRSEYLQSPRKSLRTEWRIVQYAKEVAFEALGDVIRGSGPTGFGRIARIAGWFKWLPWSLPANTAPTP